MTPYKHQEDASNFIVALHQTGKNSADRSECGTGKTLTALLAAKRLGKRPYVMAPIAAIPSWTRTADRFGMELLGVSNVEQLRRGNLPVCKKLNQEKKSDPAFDWYLPEDAILLVDEAHRFCGRGTQNSQVLSAAAYQGVPIHLMSATLTKSPLTSEAVGGALGLYGDGKYWKWCFALGTEQGKFGMEWSPTAAQRSSWAQMWARTGPSYKMADIFSEIPDNIIDHTAYDLGDVNAIYTLMAGELARLAERASEDRGNDKLTVQLRARQKIELMRVPTIVDKAKDLLSEGQRVAIFVNFTGTADAISARLDNCPILDGRNPDDRPKLVDGFNSGAHRVMVLQYQAGGASISLHDDVGDAPRASILSPTWSAIDLKQALGRIYRAGLKTKALQFIIWAKDSIEERVAEVMRRNAEQIDEVNKL